MGHASNFGHAFAKAQMATGTPLPTSGTVCISVNPFDRGGIIKIARDLHQMGFQLCATKGTADFLSSIGLEVTTINKVSDGSPHIVDMMRSGEVQLVINTPRGGLAHSDGNRIRSAAAQYNIPLVTTLSAALATVQGIRALKQKPLRVISLQKHHGIGAD
jgi:carbamoyl-phosphate synthase large subunit